EHHWTELIKTGKYDRFKNAKIYIVYSDNQKYSAASSLNEGLSESKVLQNFALDKNALIIVVDKLQTGFDEPRLHTLFLDKEVKDINAIQTISRVNRITKNKTRCKIIDFSYRNVNINNIKKAFEHFSDIVVSDFDPFNELNRLTYLYDELVKHQLYVRHFADFEYLEKNDRSNVGKYLDIEESFIRFIKSNPDNSKVLKININQYYSVITLIEYVIDFDKKYSDKIFMEFWRRYNVLYNQLTIISANADDIEIYYDNQIGITEETKPIYQKNGSKQHSGTGKKYVYDILKVIEQRNEEEENIGVLIEIFQKKIRDFFDFIRSDDKGKRLILKIKALGVSFNESEVLSNFELLYKKYKRRNLKQVGEFFFTQTEDLLEKLCSDFEQEIMSEKEE
ncbi:MAG: type I restriction endonuclease subunit R, partial [Candidatus Cloacimonetes bacterium]|nr:type I restriction endonuclease subunit R [Candidatus Cloacimonadota bacterium]